MNTVKNNKIMFIILFFLLSSTPSLFAQFHFDIEGGIVTSGYNDVRSPGDTGTTFSLSEELQDNPTYFYRGRAGYTFFDRHYISILAAFLYVESQGSINRDITYEGSLFPANTDLEASYKFNSYRFTYRYYFYNNDSFKFGAGLTGKIRDAAIAVQDDTQKAEKTDLGVVPLINFSFQWNFLDHLSLLFEGDALAAPQGRAEDILLAIQYPINDNIILRTGYRLLEGGADADVVYTFSMFHYALIGVTVIW